MTDVVRMRYELVADIVERVMGVERAELLSSKKEEATDARSILVFVLSDDLTDGEMAMCMGLTRQAVNGIRNGAMDRIRSRRMLVCCVQEIRKELARDEQRITCRATGMCGILQRRRSAHTDANG
jgi:hypothetical protein